MNSASDALDGKGHRNDRCLQEMETEPQQTIGKINWVCHHPQIY